LSGHGGKLRGYGYPLPEVPFPIKLRKEGRQIVSVGQKEARKNY